MKQIKGRAHLKADHYAEGTGIYSLPNNFGIRVLAMAKCDDGVVRTIRLNQQPDTWFSHPGRTSIKGKSVRGYITFDEVEPLEKGYPNIYTYVKFIAYKYTEQK